MPAKTSTPTKALQYVTEKGSVILPLSGPSVEIPTADEEDDRLREADLYDRVKRLKSPDAKYNCYGHVFTGGSVRIARTSVEVILRENGYVIAKKPIKGNLVVFFDQENGVAHSGIVVRIDFKGRPVIQSKWGDGGSLFEHYANDVPPGYGTPRFYHGPTSNPGKHLLRTR